MKAYYRNYNVRLFWSKFTKYILLFSKKIQSCLKCTFLAQINPLWWIYFTCIQQINCWTIYLVDRLATIVPEFLKSCINAPVDIFTCQTMKRSFVWIYLLNSYTHWAKNGKKVQLKEKAALFALKNGAAPKAPNAECKKISDYVDFRRLTFHCNMKKMTLMLVV